jgi:hypothetical protein
MNKHVKLLIPAILPILLACGGGGGGGGTTSNTPSPSNSLTVKYTDPAATDGACIIQLNRSLSTGSLMVFDVVGEKADTQTVGVCLNLQVDPAKLASANIPGDRDAEVEHILATPTASPGGFGSGAAVSMRKDRSDGYSMMVTAIRRPGAPVPASGVILRFAFQVIGSPVAGVIRTQVMDGSGLLDANGRLISGTAPVIGRLEYSQ